MGKKKNKPRYMSILKKPCMSRSSSQSSLDSFQSAIDIPFITATDSFDDEINVFFTPPSSPQPSSRVDNNDFIPSTSLSGSDEQGFTRRKVLNLPSIKTSISSSLQNVPNLPATSPWSTSPVSPASIASSSSSSSSKNTIDSYLTALSSLSTKKATDSKLSAPSSSKLTSKSGTDSNLSNASSSKGLSAEAAPFVPPNQYNFNYTFNYTFVNADGSNPTTIPYQLNYTCNDLSDPQLFTPTNASYGYSTKKRPINAANSVTEHNYNYVFNNTYATSSNNVDSSDLSDLYKQYMEITNQQQQEEDEWSFVGSKKSNKNTSSKPISGGGKKAKKSVKTGPLSFLNESHSSLLSSLIQNQKTHFLDQLSNDSTTEYDHDSTTDGTVDLEKPATFVPYVSLNPTFFNESIEYLKEEHYKNTFTFMCSGKNTFFSQKAAARFPERYKYLLDYDIFDETTLKSKPELWQLITSQPTNTMEIADREEALACIGWAQANQAAQTPLVNSALLSFTKMREAKNKEGAWVFSFYFSVKPENENENFIGCQVRKYSELMLVMLDENKTSDLVPFRVTSVKPDLITMCKSFQGVTYGGRLAVRSLQPRHIQEKIKEYESFKNEKVGIFDTPNDFVYRHTINAVEYIRTNELQRITDPEPVFEMTVDEFKKSFDKILPKLKEETGLNDRQAQVLYSICTNSHGLCPYILNGPPGTGKTRTIAQVVRYILAMDPDNRVLLSAPSNMAADMLALEIMKLIDGKLLTFNNMLRMRSNYTEFEKRDKQLDMISCIDRETKDFIIPHEFSSWRVIVCTLGCSAHIKRCPKDFFSHIIVDEAGQANHGDFWLPICGLATRNTSIILSGDPKQLGPVNDFDVDISQLTDSALLRYMSMPMYKSNPRVQCLLNKSYRCHPSILNIASKLFYNNKLLTATEDRPEPFEDWKALPKKGFPVLFINVRHGSEFKREETRSYANLEEVEAIIKVIKRLILDFHLDPREIGVISPYKHQGGWVNSKLEASDDLIFEDLSVDSVERYQGSERKVILITATRTQRMGFLASEQRLNTAITRAMHLLIVFGNKDLLISNECWREFIRYCEVNDSMINWTGEVQDF